VQFSRGSSQDGIELFDTMREGKGSMATFLPDLTGNLRVRWPPPPPPPVDSGESGSDDENEDEDEEMEEDE
jgi:hypothetical protein